jgi:tripartite-type tricarboxylate transporter receptor subunit TctC
MLNHNELMQAGNQVFSAAWRAIYAETGRMHETRRQATAALAKAAADAGLKGDDANWAVGFGLSKFGYGS